MKSINLSWILLLLMTITGITSCSEDETAEPMNEEIRFDVSPSTIEFTAEGGTKGMQISGNIGWTIEGTPDWISLSEGTGAGTTNINITAKENENFEDRNANITVNTDEEGFLEEVQIVQAAAEGPAEEVEATIPPDNTGMRDISSVQLSQEMKIGWNLGNSLDAVGGETAWGNPLVTQELIASVKAAGFNAVRIPVAWSKFSDDSDFTIREDWMIRVEEVVNYVLENDMYAIINIHWDNGWIIPTYEEEDYVTQRLEAMWQQIAIHFRNYDDRLLFAGTNEVMVEGDYGTPTEEYYTVQNGYNQTFVNTVRETGGKNTFRHLIVQGFNTNINHTLDFAEIPEDETSERLMMEVHYYDPYNFTLNETSDVYQWGEDAPESEDWANESYVDNQFLQMKTNFIDQGVGVILGEYGAIKRENVEGHEAYREYYMKYVTKSAVDHGLVPFYWDNGNTGDLGFGLFDRNSGELVHPELVGAIMSAVE